MDWIPWNASGSEQVRAGSLLRNCLIEIQRIDGAAAALGAQEVERRSALAWQTIVGEVLVEVDDFDRIQARRFENRLTGPELRAVGSVIADHFVEALSDQQERAVIRVEPEGDVEIV